MFTDGNIFLHFNRKFTPIISKFWCSTISVDPSLKDRVNSENWEFPTHLHHIFTIATQLTEAKCNEIQGLWSDKEASHSLPTPGASSLSYAFSQEWMLRWTELDEQEAMVNFRGPVLKVTCYLLNVMCSA